MVNSSSTDMLWTLGAHTHKALIYKIRNRSSRTHHVSRLHHNYDWSSSSSANVSVCVCPCIWVVGMHFFRHKKKWYRRDRRQRPHLKLINAQQPDWQIAEARAVSVCVPLPQDDMFLIISIFSFSHNFLMWISFAARGMSMQCKTHPMCRAASSVFVICREEKAHTNTSIYGMNGVCIFNSFFFRGCISIFCFRSNVDARAHACERVARRRIRTFDRGVHTHETKKKCKMWTCLTVHCAMRDPINCERGWKWWTLIRTLPSCRHLAKLSTTDFLGGLRRQYMWKHSDKCDFTRIDMVCGDQSLGLFFAACNLRVRALSRTANASSSSGWLCFYRIYRVHTVRGPDALEWVQ